MPLIEADGVDVVLGEHRIVSNVSMTVGPGEVVALIGPNGAGKTTMVRVLLGLLPPARGIVRRQPGLKVGYMPQRMAIDPALPLTVERLLRLAVSPGAGATARLLEVLDEVGAGHVAAGAMQDLSGGELQRVLLARALLREPDLLVLDEPVQGVDVAGQVELYALIARIRERRQCGVLVVSHDLHLVMAATDRVVCLNHHVCCAGHPEAVSRDPAFIALFGPQAATAFAIYHHHHDHRHDAHGEVVPLGSKTETSAHG
ncbi:MAG: zinc ABC transporter ATP-binding protein [Rhodospirillales bacterium RIFCSPLOWO2_12_FULL_67_15]|nr:MAG: zinc ABC transporter ATP-binding protein [Rhodospirillales bacterium RIFCSPLOWO2_12_FULL_67_15]